MDSRRFSLFLKIAALTLFAIGFPYKSYCQQFNWSHIAIEGIRMGTLFTDSQYYGEKMLDQSILEINYLCSFEIDTISHRRFESESTLQIGKAWTKFQERNRLSYELTAQSMFEEAVRLYTNFLVDNAYYLTYSDTYFINQASKTSVFTCRFGADDYRLEEPFEPISWEICDSIKTVGGYSCQLARSFCYGRWWNAWFSYDIPYPGGPWKLSGLPGLIMEAYDDAGQYSFVVSEIEPSNRRITMATYPYLRMTRKQYRKMVREAIENYIPFINAHIARCSSLRAIEEKPEVGAKYYKQMRFELIEKE